LDLDLEIHWRNRMSNVIGRDVADIRYSMQQLEKNQNTGFFSSIFSKPNPHPASVALVNAIQHNELKTASKENDQSIKRNDQQFGQGKK